MSREAALRPGRPIALITRPERDGAGLAHRVAAIGYRPVLAPLLEIVFEFGGMIDFRGVGGLAFTSSNGVRALAAWLDRRAPADGDWSRRVRALPSFAVGDATRATARAAGFETVFSASGDVLALGRLIVAHRAALGHGRLLHVRGEAAAGDLASVLQQTGISTDIVKLYEARPVDRLPDAALGALRGGTPSAVLLYSPRTASRFAALAQDDMTGPSLCHCLAACLSPAVARHVRALPFDRIVIAARPDTDSLLEAMLEARPA